MKEIDQGSVAFAPAGSAAHQAKTGAKKGFAYSSTPIEKDSLPSTARRSSELTLPSSNLDFIHLTSHVALSFEIPMW